MKVKTLNNFNDYKKLCDEEMIDVIDECPICHTKTRITEGVYVTSDDESNNMMICECPNQECGEMFVSKYKWIMNRREDNPSIFPYVVQTNIRDEIKAVSPSFVEIFSQATKAKEERLDQICGVGYRKALEFLIKDYCKINNPNEIENIEKSQLMPVINNYIDNKDIKDMATRAVWIGNDETHYIRKWSNKDIHDLLMLIEITCNWIMLVENTKKYRMSMEKGK